MHCSVQGMYKNFNKIKLSKNKSAFFNTIGKSFSIKPEYQNTGDFLLPKDAIDSDISQSVKISSKSQQPKVSSGIKMKKCRVHGRERSAAIQLLEIRHLKKILAC